MELSKEMCEVICDLEYEIGSECYNSTYDGYSIVRGCEYRYPVIVPKKHGEYVKIREKIIQSWEIDNKEIKPKTIKNIRYQFGSNELFVGLGLINVLEYLENRYNLDFNELEKKKREEVTFKPKSVCVKI